MIVSPTVLSGLRFEAEDITLSGVVIQTNSAYSKGQGVQSNALGGNTGDASFTYNGTTGDYDIIVAYLEEDDGGSTHKIFVDGIQIDSWVAELSASGFELSTHTTNNVAVNNGDVVKITGAVAGGSHGRMDYLEYSSTSSSSKIRNKKNLVDEEEDLDTRFLLYPNPVKDIITFQFHHKTAGSIRFSEYDFSDRVVTEITKSFNKGNQNIVLNIRENGALPKQGVLQYKLKTDTFVKLES